MALSFALAAAAQARITGVVVERSGAADPVPVADVSVLAKTGSPERTIAAAVTDSRGRYAFADLPEGRVTLSVQAQGYYTVKAGGLESESIARSCPATGDCAATDFEVARAAVVEGWLTDAYGDPFQDAFVSLTPSSEAGVSNPMERMRNARGQANSDDRGYFRFWGIKPGSYELTVQESPSLGRPGAQERQTIEIPRGETHYETRLTLKTGDVRLFTVSGEVVGLAEGARQRGTNIMIQPSGDDPNQFGWGNGTELRDGRFLFGGVPPGRYVLRVSTPERRWAYLDTLTVDRDLVDLRLTPQPPTGLRGRLEFVDSPAALPYVGLRSSGGSQFGYDRLDIEPPDHTFQNDGLAPGEYELDLTGSAYYLVDPAPIRVTLGQVKDIVVRLSSQRAAVRGVVRLAGGNREAAAHFTVGLRGERGRHKVQADDAGGFLFEKIIPGDYEIAAWDAPDVDIRTEEAWRPVQGTAKRLTLEPGFETEVDLTVTP